MCIPVGKVSFEDCDLLLPYTKPALVGEVRRHLRVIAESYTDEGVTLCVRAPHDTILLFRQKHGL